MSQLASAKPRTEEEKAKAYGDDLIAQIGQADAMDERLAQAERRHNEKLMAVSRDANEQITQLNRQAVERARSMTEELLKAERAHVVQVADVRREADEEHATELVRAAGSAAVRLSSVEARSTCALAAESIAS